MSLDKHAQTEAADNNTESSDSDSEERFYEINDEINEKNDSDNESLTDLSIGELKCCVCLEMMVPPRHPWCVLMATPLATVVSVASPIVPEQVFFLRS